MHLRCTSSGAVPCEAQYNFSQSRGGVLQGQQGSIQCLSSNHGWRRWCRRTGRLTRRWTPAGRGMRTLQACCGPTSAAWASPPWAAPAPASPARSVLKRGLEDDTPVINAALGILLRHAGCRQ